MQPGPSLDMSSFNNALSAPTDGDLMADDEFAAAIDAGVEENMAVECEATAAEGGARKKKKRGKRLSGQGLRQHAARSSGSSASSYEDD